MLETKLKDIISEIILEGGGARIIELNIRGWKINFMYRTKKNGKKLFQKESNAQFIGSNYISLRCTYYYH